MRKICVLTLLIVCALFGGAFGQQSPAPASDQVPDTEEVKKLNSQIDSLFREKNYDEALPLAKRALELRQGIPGLDKQLLANSINVIADIYRAKAEYDEAGEFYEKALKLLEAKWGSASKNLTRTIENLALTRFARKDNSGAEKLYLRSLQIKEAELGSEHLETGRTLAIVGLLYDRIGKKGKAVEYYKRALTIVEKNPGGTDSEVVDLLYKCGCALTEDDRIEESKQYLARAEKNQPPPESKGGVIQGTAILRWEPNYPMEARSAGASGPVVVRVLVNECGRVIEATALNGNNLLKSAAVAAAKQWRFTPTRLLNRPVKVIGTITFNFNLGRRP